MNLSSGDDLYVSGFQSELRDDAISIAMSLASMSMASSNHSLLTRNTKSEASGSPPSLRSNAVAVQDGPIEVDFYRNPTMLSRMILFNKFANAQKRCRDHPWEASVWVCAKRKSNSAQSSSMYGMFEQKGNTTDNTAYEEGGNGNDKYSLRQLPIHIACTSLAFAHDATSRADLEQLIVRLVVTYPDGCAEFDHAGKLPLHEAIWSNASPETTAMLLMASPHSIDQRDKFGRTPMELNNRRTGRNNKDEIRDMLNLGAQYWEHARQEAKLRMKLAVPGGGKSIDSQGALGTSEIDKESIYTSASLVLPPRPKPHPVQIESEEILPMAWEQLERRVLLLEQLLAEMYEQNYELAGLVEELKQAKKTLRLELEAARTNTMQYNPKDKDRGNIRSSLRSSSLSSCPSVAVVPEDDEMSSIKLMEQAERIEQLESLVDSYHSTRRKGAIPECLGTDHSYVSGLTYSEESFFYDTGMSLPSKETRHRGDELHGHFPAIAEDVRGTTNLDDSFQRKWTPPIATTSFLPANAAQNRRTPMAVEEVDDAMSGKKAAHRSQTATNTSEIYFPGAHARASVAHSSAMSENSTIISVVDTDIHYAAGRRSLESRDESYLGSHDESDSEEYEEDFSGATKSTRARLEDMVFGSALVPDDEGEEGSYRPQRYNYDIKIPALDRVDTPSDETGEI